MPDVSSGPVQTLLCVLILILTPLLIGWFARRASASDHHTLRPIPAFDRLRGLLGRVAESGQIVHLALGNSGLGGQQTAIAASGLAVLRYLADQGAFFNIAPVVTVADPALMLAAQDVLERVYRARDLTAQDHRTAIQMIAPEPTAYAIGAQDWVEQEKVAANVMIGQFGQEFLLLGEAGAQREIIQIGGSSDVHAQPWLLATCPDALFGEEALAAAAYLTRQPAQIASLRAQDALRVLVVAGILLGVLIKTLLGG